MKLVTWLATDSEAIFGTMEAPVAVAIKAIAHTQDASSYLGLCFETVVPTLCTVVTVIPADTFYNIHKPIDGYWMTLELARSTANSIRQTELDALTVIVGTNTYDADEKSQERMNRAYTVLGDAGVIEWTMADNNTDIVTGAILKEALILAGQAQSALWAKYL